MFLLIWINRKDRKMALIQLGNVEEAVAALIVSSCHPSIQNHHEYFIVTIFINIITITSVISIIAIIIIELRNGKRFGCSTSCHFWFDYKLIFGLVSVFIFLYLFSIFFPLCFCYRKCTITNWATQVTCGSLSPSRPFKKTNNTNKAATAARHIYTHHTHTHTHWHTQANKQTRIQDSKEKKNEEKSKQKN